MKKLDKDLIARLIISILVLVNIVATMLGYKPIEYDESSVYPAVSIVVTIVTWAWGFWKNNNFTDAAREGQKVIDEIKRSDKNDL